MHHLIDFGVAGERHFYATGHGKGACDDVGGTVKRIARRSYLQSGIKKEILASQKLYEWAKENFVNDCETFFQRCSQFFCKHVSFLQLHLWGKIRQMYPRKNFLSPISLKLLFLAGAKLKIKIDL